MNYLWRLKQIAKGQFKFNGKSKFYYLVAEDIGYGSKRVKLNPRKNKNNDIHITLELNGIPKW